MGGIQGTVQVGQRSLRPGQEKGKFRKHGFVAQVGSRTQTINQGPQPTGQSHPCIRTTPGKAIGVPSTTPSLNMAAESTVDPDIVPTAFGHCQVPTWAAGWPVSVSHHCGRPGPHHYPSCLNRSRGFLADVPGRTLAPESPTAAEVLFENCICNHVTPFFQPSWLPIMLRIKSPPPPSSWTLPAPPASPPILSSPFFMSFVPRGTRGLLCCLHCVPSAYRYRRKNLPSRTEESRWDNMVTIGEAAHAYVHSKLTQGS